MPTEPPARWRLSPEHPRWPKALDALFAPPNQLFGLGRPPPYTNALAIVGTRRADPEALDFAEQLGAEFAVHGFTLISGGAVGIDAAAHRGALQAGGCTVAVLPTGISAPYPRQHRSLFEAISRQGALVSELEGSVPPRPGRFLHRNRLIAALASTVVVVQAPLRSGALSTAAHAMKLGKAVYAVPASPWDPRGLGCLTLLQQGCQVCTGAADVLLLAPLASPMGRQPEDVHDGQRSADHSPQEVRIRAVLGARPRHLDELASLSGVGLEQTRRIVLAMLMDGELEERGAGWYCRKRADRNETHKR